MAYSADSFTALEVPTLAKMNKLWSNDASMNDGTGIANNAILNRHLADDVATPREWTNPYTFDTTKTSAQNTTLNTFVKLLLNIENFDSNSNYDNATLYRYIAPVTGRYWFYGAVGLGVSAATIFIPALYKNGVEIKRGTDLRVSAASKVGLTQGFLQLTAGDYVELFIFADVTVALDVSGAWLNYFGGFLVDQT